MRKALADAWSTVRWYTRGVMAEDRYDRYIAHQRAAHPGKPVMSKKEYWRMRFDEQERSPKMRCC